MRGAWASHCLLVCRDCGPHQLIPALLCRLCPLPRPRSVNFLHLKFDIPHAAAGAIPVGLLGQTGVEFFVPSRGDHLPVPTKSQRAKSVAVLRGHGGLWRDIEAHNRLSESLAPEQQNGIHKLPRRADRLPVDTARDPTWCDSQLFCLGATPDLHDVALSVHATEERAEGSERCR